MRAHLDTLEALLACTTPDELRRSVSEYVKVLGFDSWVYAANPTGQNAFPYVLSAYPTAWLMRCIENGLFGVDPVVAPLPSSGGHRDGVGPAWTGTALIWGNGTASRTRRTTVSAETSSASAS